MAPRKPDSQNSDRAANEPRWLRRVEIQNFLSHRDTVLELSPGINVLQGSSSAGKSNILRAIVWVVLNRPTGTTIIRRGADVARVTLELSDGTRVTRERGKRINRYSVQLPDGTEHTLSGFGTAVPPEVQQALGMAVTDDGELLNWAPQLDAPFLVGAHLTPVSRADLLSQLAGAEVYDAAVRDVSHDLISIQRHQLPPLEDELQRTEKLVTMLSEAPAALAQIDELLQTARRLQAEWGRLERTAQALARVQQLSELLARVAQELPPETEADEIAGLLADAEKAAQTTSVLQRWQLLHSVLSEVDAVLPAVQTWEQLDTEIAEAERLVALLQRAAQWQSVAQIISQIDLLDPAELTALRQDIEWAAEQWQRLQRIEQLYARWAAIVQQLQQQMQLLQQLQSRRQAIVQYITQLVAQSGRCPLCQQPVDDPARIATAMTEAM